MTDQLPLFYGLPETLTSTLVTLSEEEHQHLFRVLRLGEGDRIWMTDGLGARHTVRLTAVGKRATQGEIERTERPEPPPTRRLSLFPAVLKHPDRLEWLVEKATELGVTALEPLMTERVVARNPPKPERWRRLALAAMKQSERLYLPAIGDGLRFQTALAEASPTAVKLIPHERATLPLRDALPPDATEIVALIGPEGGFSEREIEQAKAAGFVAVSLGPHRLRAETAALVTATLVLLG